MSTFAINEMSGELQPLRFGPGGSQQSHLVILCSDLGARRAHAAAGQSSGTPTTTAPSFPRCAHEAGERGRAVGNHVLVLSSVDEDEGLNGKTKYSGARGSGVHHRPQRAHWGPAARLDRKPGLSTHWRLWPETAVSTAHGHGGYKKYMSLMLMTNRPVCTEPSWHFSSLSHLQTKQLPSSEPVTQTRGPMAPSRSASQSPSQCFLLMNTQSNSNPANSVSVGNIFLFGCR